MYTPWYIQDPIHYAEGENMGDQKYHDINNIVDVAFSELMS